MVNHARPTARAAMLIAALSAPFLLLTPGCATAERSGELVIDEDRYPPDFAVAVTVLAPRMNDSPRVPAVHRPARYIVETDSVLRAAVGPGVREETHPPIVRRLTHDEVQGLWHLVRDGGLAERGRADEVGSPPRLEGATGRTRYVVWVAAEGHSRVLLIDGERTGDATALVARLAALANVPQPSGDSPG